jgi:hypothetical protein
MAATAVSPRNPRIGEICVPILEPYSLMGLREADGFNMLNADDADEGRQGGILQHATLGLRIRRGRIIVCATQQLHICRP